MTPELPMVGCPLPAAAAPSPTPSAGPTPTPTPTPTSTATSYAPRESAPDLQPEPVVAAPAHAAVLVTGPLPVGAPTLAPVASPMAAAPVVPVVSAAPVAQGVPLTSVVPSAYAIVVFGLIGAALLLSFLSGLRPHGGTMKTTRTRLWAGLATIAAAAGVGGIGWYRIAGEPLLNRQVPFLASAGIAVVVLAVLGGALIVAEQLRADQNRMGELEDAVRSLTETLAPLVEQPARRAESDALLQ
jgi:hypothetical protein